MQEQMSDSEDGDSDYDDLEINDTSAILNLNPAYGQTIALIPTVVYHFPMPC
jgi:hypothetical protein